MSTPAEGLGLGPAVEAAVEEWRRRSEGTPDERASISWPRDRTRILVEAAAPLIAEQAAAKALLRFAEMMATAYPHSWRNDPAFSMAVKAARQVGLEYQAGRDPYRAQGIEGPTS